MLKLVCEQALKHKPQHLQGYVAPPGSDLHSLYLEGYHKLLMQLPVMSTSALAKKKGTQNVATLMAS